MGNHFDTIAKEIGRLPDQRIFGRVANVVGLLIEVTGVEVSTAEQNQARGAE